MSISCYEADFDQEYEILTRKHKSLRSQLESALSSYLREGKGKPVTIQGPYGSGKTQLLYYLFRFTWREGGIGIYTHLEKIIPTEEMGPSKYADHLGKLINEEVDLLRKGESKLMTGKPRDHAVNHIKKLDGTSHRVVLFVDEIEQKYKLLDKQVRTDDHSPMREIIARVNKGEAPFYIVLAFAPVSFYEFSRGEAQTGRFLPIILPIIEPKTFRKVFGDIGNLVWWMGKGRYRGVARTRDIFEANVFDIKKISKRELQDVCRNIGSIGDVEPLNFVYIERVDDFDSFRDFLINLGPQKEGGELYSGDIKIVTKCRICSREHNLNNLLEKCLRISKVSSVTDIAYYLSIILDAFSTCDGRIPLFIDLDDWKELFDMVGDIILEFEGEGRLPSQDLDKLRGDSEFVFNIRREAENIALLEEGYCITPNFVRTLFPFPISSPNLTSKEINEQRENLGDQTYLGREERDGISILFFLNEDKIGEFLLQETKSFLKETKALFAVNLGEKEEFDIPEVAKWLQKEGRLKITAPRGILSDFLVSFFYWLRTIKGESLPIARLFEKLLQYQQYQWITEKDKARKIAYYSSRLKEYLDSQSPKSPAAKYVLKDKTGFNPKIGLASEVMGFAFVDSKNDYEAIYKFRQEFESTQFIQGESNKKQTGVPTALPALVVKEKGSKGISKEATLRRIKDSFDAYLPDLKKLVHELSVDEFITIPSDEDSAIIFRGIYLFQKWNDPSKAMEKLQEAKSKWDALIEQIDDLSAKIAEFENLVDKYIRLSYGLEADKDRIANIGTILNEYQAKISPYTKFLLSTFVERTAEIVEPKLNEIEKTFKEFREDVEDEIKKYKSDVHSIEVFDVDTFKWINKNKDEVIKEFQERFKDVCQELTKGARISLDNRIPNDVSTFTKSVGEIIEEIKVLKEINAGLEQCKVIARKINEKLRTWGD